MKNLNEIELVKGCLKEKREYQKELFRRFSGRMMAVCCRYSRNREDAQDILQESFIKIFKSLPAFRGEGSLEGWIRKTVVYTAINFYRKFYYENEKTGIESTHEKIEFVPEIIDELNEKEIISMISKLPSSYRMIFNMHIIEGFSHREIAEMMNMEESTSRSQLHKARLILQKLINETLKILV